MALAGCGGPGAMDGMTDPAHDSVSGESPNVGTVTLDLTLTTGLSIATVSYDIHRGAYHKPGNIDVSNSTGASVLVDGIPIGTGYTVTMNATTAGSSALACNGSSSFDVTGTAVAAVPVHLTCIEASRAATTNPVPVPPSALLALCGLLLASGLALLGRVAPSIREARLK
jgi:hypothetical protein